MPSTIDLNALSTGMQQQPQSSHPPEITPAGDMSSSTQQSISNNNQQQQYWMPIQQPTTPTNTVPQYQQQSVPLTYMPPTQPTSNIQVTINDRDGKTSVDLHPNWWKDPYMLIKVLHGLSLIWVWIIILLEQVWLREIQYYNIDMIQIWSLVIIWSWLAIMLMRSWAIRLLWSLMTVCVLIGILLLTFWASFGPDSAIWLHRNIEINSDTTTLWTLSFESIISSFSLETNPSISWITWSIHTDRPLSYITGTQQVFYKEYADWNPLQSINSTYIFSLWTKSINKLYLKQAYGNNSLNLLSGNIKNIVINSSSSSNSLILWPNMSWAVIDLMWWWIDTSLLLAKNVWVLIEYKPARWAIWWWIKGSITPDSDPTIFTSINYSTAKYKITVRINMIVWSLSVEQL